MKFTMKKTYIKPQTVVIVTSPMHLMAGSLNPGDQSDPGMGAHEDLIDFEEEEEFSFFENI